MMRRSPNTPFGRGTALLLAILAGTAAPYTLCLNPTNYLLGWRGVPSATSYSYSVDGGATWTTRGTSQWASVSGRTASTVDSVVVRAFFSDSTSADSSISVSLPATGSPTYVPSVIGTGSNPITAGSADYSTPQAWADAGATVAGNSSLVTANKCLVGLMLNEEFLNHPVTFGDGSAAGLANNTMVTDATHYREVTAFPGAAWTDYVNRRSVPLRYTAANGAAMKYASSTDNPTIDLREGYSRCSRLQISSVGNGTTSWGGWGVHSSSSSAPVYAHNMLIESGTSGYVLSFNFGPHYASNCVLINIRPVSATPTIETIVEENNGCIHYNCLSIALGQTPPIAMTARVSATSWENSGFFGATRLFSVYSAAGGGTGNPTFSHCFTDSPFAKDISGSDIALPAGVTYCSLSDAGFTDTTFGTGNYDLRLKQTSVLRGAGVLNASYPRDVTGVPRLSGLVDVGPWQTT